jgi:hypothetical protein
MNPSSFWRVLCESKKRRAREKKFFAGPYAMLLKKRYSTSQKPDEQNRIPDA